MTKLMTWKMTCAVLVLCAATAITSHAQVFNTLVSFDNSDGSLPSYGQLVQGRDGNFYGTVHQGGSNGDGTVFRITLLGKLATEYNFCGHANCSDGSYPASGVILASDGDFYGTTYAGGVYQFGTVFKLSPVRELTVIHSFDSTDGAGPQADMIQATDGNFYGTTDFGGTNSEGTVFRITPKGILTTLHSFVGTDGVDPLSALVQASDGNFYGVTQGGGDNQRGTVYRITTSGNLTTLYSFCAQTNCADGAGPNGLAEGADGRFYGTTSVGGDSQCQSGCGTVFRITPEGTLTTLYTFCGQTNCPDGDFPYAGLVQATDGNFYGTTYQGGANGGGTIFRITPGGELTTLYLFCTKPGCADGYGVSAALLQSTNGSFYGTTYQGGTYSCSNGAGCGTVFTLDMGLGPFVAFVRNSGKVGQTGGILGQGFTGTTSVSINGIPAAFTVRSDTFITATVPPGATTGYVTVATPSGTLTSNVPFRVLP